MEFVGLKNFVKLFHDSGFRISVTNTLYYAVFTVPLTMVAALLIAVLLNSKIKGIVVYRTAFFFPYVASPGSGGRSVEHAVPAGIRPCQ